MLSAYKARYESTEQCINDIWINKNIHAHAHFRKKSEQQHKDYNEY